MSTRNSLEMMKTPKLQEYAKQLQIVGYTKLSRSKLVQEILVAEKLKWKEDNKKNKGVEKPSEEDYIERKPVSEPEKEDTGNRGVVENYIFEQLDKGSTKSAVIRVLLKEYQLPRADIARLMEVPYSMVMGVEQRMMKAEQVRELSLKLADVNVKNVQTAFTEVCQNCKSEADRNEVKSQITGIMQFMELSGLKDPNQDLYNIFDIMMYDLEDELWRRANSSS